MYYIVKTILSRTFHSSHRISIKLLFADINIHISYQIVLIEDFKKSVDSDEIQILSVPAFGILVTLSYVQDILCTSRQIETKFAWIYSKTCLTRPLKKSTKIGFQY